MLVFTSAHISPLDLGLNECSSAYLMHLRDDGCAAENTGAHSLHSKMKREEKGDTKKDRFDDKIGRRMRAVFTANNIY